MSANPKTVYSKVSVKSQTVLPQAVRERLRIKPGDRLRYVLDDKGVRLERSAPNEEDDPFATFTEWASEADDEAYADL
ncbi:MAG: type II toxin-antitoxin system PrlF family antitoxin [Methylocystis sp.]|nr:type II toxin-antitoxin system PrlF family antitoxin [Methylocystis sp.]